MKTRKLFSRMIFLAACIWLIVTFAGCSSSNSINSLNPAASDPESSISRGTDTVADTEISLAPVVNIFASRTTVGPQAEIDLRAEAVDPAGGQVAITWEAANGTIITANGSNAVWKAPSQTSTSKIACIATDVRGTSTRAEISVEVIGNSVYRLVVNADRSSVLTSRITSDPASPFVPVAGARVSIEGFGDSAVTDSSGAVEFSLDQGDVVASSAVVSVSYYDWEASYVAALIAPDGSRIVDSLTFYPGYDSVSVAIARGDSFQLKRGMLEVTTFENAAGAMQPIAEVLVNAGAAQAVSDREAGRALVLSSSAGNAAVNISLTRNGYQTIEGYQVPVAIDGVTLVRARLSRSGVMTDSAAVISYTSPYNGQRSFPVTGTFVVGFGQPMEKSTIFDSFNMMVENKITGVLTAISGAEIKKRFRIEWVGDTVLKLHPLSNLAPMARFSYLINNWDARAADGRILKSYSGMYGEFFTDDDPEPVILSTSPRNGDVGVGRSGPFSITFNSSMVPDSLYNDLEIEISSLDSGSRLVVDGQSLRSHFSVTWKDNYRVVELVPYRMLRANASYLIRLRSSAMVSASGKKVSGLANLWGQFKTADL